MNMQMVKKLQKLQKEMTKTQDEINNSTFSANANGVVEVEVMGDKNIKSIKVVEGAIESIDDIEILCDSITVALNNAMTEIDKETSEKMSKYAQLAGMGM